MPMRAADTLKYGGIITTAKNTIQQWLTEFQEVETFDQHMGYTK